MNVTRVGTRKKIKKANREKKKPLHDRLHGMATHFEDVDELFFGDTPFAFASDDE